MYGFTISVDGNSVAQMKAIEAQLTSMGVKAQIETKEVGDTFAAMGVKVKESLGGIKSLLIGGFGIGALMEGFEFLKESKKDFDDMQKATADLGQTMLTMGGAVGVTEGELNEMAEAMNKTTVNSKAAIVSAQALMLTFGNVKGKQFEEGMKSAGDYAAKFFKGDLMEASKSLGIALDDPIKGMARLHRTGVSFSDTQKEQIKNLQEAGKLTEAQEIILKEIKRETKDQAEIFAKTDAGQLLMAKKQWEDIHLTIGRLVSKIQVDLIPLFTVFINGLKKGVEIGKELKEWFTGVSKSALAFKSVLIAIGGYYTYIGVQAAIAAAKTGLLALSNWYAAAGFSAEAAAAEIFTGNMWGLNAAMDANPVGLIIAGLTTLGVAFYIAWQKSDTFRAGMKGLWEAIKVFGEAIADVFIGIKKIFSGDFTEGIVQLTNSFSGAGAKAGDAFRTAFDREMLKSTTDAFNIEFDKKLEALNKKKEDGKIKDEDYKKELVVLQKEAQNANLHGKLSGAGLTLDTDKLRDILHPKKFAGVNGGGTGLKDSAINTSNLSGASGGLGQAKIINIKIDTVQKIYGVVSKDLKSKGQDAAEMIIRTANNMQGGQSM